MPRHLVAFFAVLISTLARAEVPPPSAMPVEMVISGRTSTLKAIAVENVGQEIPQTFSKDRLKNAAGYVWFVSRHYALQTDYDAARARHLLTLLELAYPHYVELFGREIAGIDQTRMAVIYGSSTESLKVALAADGIAWDFGGGGITYEGFNAAFNYPSGTLQYHQRYIMLHECAHLYQMCLNGSIFNTPGWYYEGVADAVSHHVWDESMKQLTMMVFDKPTINNWLDTGLGIYAKEPFKASDILRGTRGGRDLNFLLVSYFTSDVERLMRWRIWQEETFRQAPESTAAADGEKRIDELFGGEKLDADFDAWLKARKSSFHYVDWGWEQDADVMISYGWPQTGAFSQTDLGFSPGDVTKFDALVMDYPLQPQSSLVGTVKRGTAEPVVGCVVSFKSTPGRGVAGMGLGVEGRTYVKVLIEEGKRLVIDGTDLGAARASIDFPDQFRDAAAKSFDIGLTIRIAEKELRVIARTEGASDTTELVLPLTSEQRARLLKNRMAVLSRDGRHRITPYVDDARRGEPDLMQPAAANRWRFGLMPELYAAERAIWRLGAAAPVSLRGLRDKLMAAVGEDQARQGALQAKYAEDLKDVLADVRKCEAAPGAVDAAIRELQGK